MRLAIPLAALVLGLSCHGSHDAISPPSPPPVGALAYTGYDENGQAVVRGWVELDLPDPAVDPLIPTNVTGTWHLDEVAPGGGIGPQVGEGTLQGYLQNDQLYVDLNPARVDDNVVADGTYVVIGGPAGGASWKGTWIWSTISGPRRSGTFEASR